MLRQLSPLDFFPLATTSEFVYDGHATHPIYYIYTKTTFNLCGHPPCRPCIANCRALHGVHFLSPAHGVAGEWRCESWKETGGRSPAKKRLGAWVVRTAQRRPRAGTPSAALPTAPPSAADTQRAHPGSEPPTCTSPPARKPEEPGHPAEHGSLATTGGWGVGACGELRVFGPWGQGE